MSEDARVALTAALFLLLVASAWFDLSRSRIPDALTMPALGGALALSFFAGGWAEGSPCLKVSLLGAAAGAGLLFIPWCMGGMGAGDVKLMAAVGALSGLPLAIRAAVLSALVGAAMGLIIVIWKGRLAETLGRTLSLAAFRRPASSILPPVTVPFGFAISLGTIWAVLLDQGVMG